MNDTIEKLFNGHDFVTKREVMTYFRLARSTVRKKMTASGIPPAAQGTKHLLSREQVRRLFPEQ